MARSAQQHGEKQHGGESIGGGGMALGM